MSMETSNVKLYINGVEVHGMSAEDATIGEPLPIPVTIRIDCADDDAVHKPDDGVYPIPAKYGDLVMKTYVYYEDKTYVAEGAVIGACPVCRVRYFLAWVDGKLKEHPVKGILTIGDRRAIVGANTFEED